MKRILIFILMIFLPKFIFAQVESKSTIILSNSIDSLRQVSGISFPINDSAGVNAQSFVSGQFYYGEANSTLIVLDFTPDYIKLDPGTYFNIRFNITNTNNLQLQVDQLPAKNILNYNGLPLDSGVISNGEIITVVYNGTDFTIMNPPKEKCPNGFIPVNDRYCIEANERTSLNFYNATVACGNDGYELCGLSDWFYACNNAIGILNMTNNYEWVNNAGNSGTQIKIMGMDPVGNTGCNKSYSMGAGSTNAFRCCYYLKK